MSDAPFEIPAGCPDIVTIGRQLWGDPTKQSKTEVRFGSHESKVVRPGDNTWYDHEADTGGGYFDLYKLKYGSLPAKPEFPIPPGMAKELGEPVAWWDYHDEAGRVVARVVRFHPPGKEKTYRQCRPHGDGWRWKMEGLQIPLYHLPDLLRAPTGATVHITEGEKHADLIRSWDMYATTNAGGAKKFRADHAAVLAPFDCVILPDNDQAGREHAAVVAQALRAAGCTSIRIASLPGLPEKGDVMDWVQAGGTAAEFEHLSAEALPYEAEIEPSAPLADDDEIAPALRTFIAIETWAERVMPPPDRLLGDLVTPTTRMFLVGRTGLGKTLFAMGLGAGMASGQGFLHWRSTRAARVLVIDGEMPDELIRRRSIDVLRRADVPPKPGNLMIYARDQEDDFEKLFPTIGRMPPLNTEQGMNWTLAFIAALGGVDVVIFDNVMSLIAGDQKDEVPWSDTLPLVQRLTAKRIGQIWIDHTGHNTDRQYGSSTKAWRFDAVGIMAPLPDDQRDKHEVAFNLSFEHPGKARRRTPDNWADFETCTIRLKDDRWTSEPAGNHAAGKPTAKLRGDAALGLHVLTDTVASEGGPLPTGSAFPTIAMRGVSESAWRREFYRRLTDRTQDARQKAFRRMVDELRDASLVGLCDGWVWPVRQAQTSP
jgi:hypothetical protein